MKKIILFLFCALVAIEIAQAQSGLNVYTGLSSATNKSALITPEGYTHNGYHLGADARLIEGNMYFVIGGQYHVINYISSADSPYLSLDSKMKWLKLRIGLGYNLITINSKIAITAKTLGSINVISSYPSDIAGAPFDNYNTGTAGAVLGLGLDIYSFTLNVEYEKGFFNAVNMVPETEFDFLTLSVGFRF